MDRDHLLEVVRRGPVLAALAEGPLSPRDLTDRLDHSRSTVHRIATRLEEAGLVERGRGELELTPLGDAVAAELRAFECNVRAAHRLEPLLECFEDLPFDFDVERFADATVTESEPGNPYRPVQRFMSLVEDTGTLRGADPAAINPLHLDALHQAILDGMETDAIFRRDVVEELVRNNPERARTAFESGNLTLRARDEVTFGLTLCDDRVGVSVYDQDTGMMELYADTDAEAAREWGERVFEALLEDAETIDWENHLVGDD